MNLAVGLAPCFAVALLAPADAPVGIEALTRLDALPLFRDSVCRQASSFDRSGGNSDYGHFVAEKDGVVTLVDVRGPGCIYRIWSANPSGTFRLYLNGEARPRVECPFADLFSGKTAPFLPPLAGVSSGGSYSHVPIPFARSCRIDVEGGERFYYQVTYHQFPATKEIPTFEPKPTPEDLVLLDRAQQIQRYLADPFGDSDGKAAVERAEGPIASGQSEVLAEIAGPSEIRSIHLAIEPRHRDVLRGAVLRIFWEGEKDPSVEVPVADFFGCGFGDRSFHSLLLGMDREGYWCTFPMPFARSARIEIANDSPIAIDSLRAEITHRRLEVAPRGSGRFHARWHRATTQAGKPHVVLETKGRGHFVGCTMTMQGTTGLHYLEGDEQVFVDGEKEPSIVGTGTEDYFDGGWYFNRGEFALGLHGVPLKDEPFSRIAAYRFHVGDCIPFKKSIRFQIEHGGTNDQPGCDYASVAYWYQEEPHEPGPAMPPFEGRRLRSPRVAGVVEAENEQPLGSPPASLETDTSLPFEASGGRFLRIASGPGDPQGMAFPVSETGVHELIVGIVPLAGGGGRFSPGIDGKAQPVVLDVRSVAPGKRCEFSIGLAKLDRGRHQLQFAPQGDGFFGLDYVRLVAPHREHAVVEAESLRAIASPEGRRTETEMGTLRWSGGGQLHLRGEAPGDAVVLEISIGEAAVYDVTAVLTRGPGYGRLRASLDGGPPGEPFDGYAGALERSPFVSLVRGATLAPGAHRLRLEVEGKAESSAGFDLGIDCVRLHKSFEAGSLEVERLVVVESSGGKLSEQDMSGFGQGFSGDAQLLFTPRAVGSFVTLEFPVAENGTYEIAVRYTRAADYGRVQAALDGRPLGRPFDGFNRGVVPSGRVVLGLEYLRRGKHTMRFTVVGKHDDSSGFFVGLDAIGLSKKY